MNQIHTSFKIWPMGKVSNFYIIQRAITNIRLLIIHVPPSFLRAYFADLN